MIRVTDRESSGWPALRTYANPGAPTRPQSACARRPAQLRADIQHMQSLDFESFGARAESEQ